MHGVGTDITKFKVITQDTYHIRAQMKFLQQLAWKDIPRRVFVCIIVIILY